uniref:NADP-dependent oxidoreductase domain-containing protein n=1 Tax=Dunaliella tertiolecta TaxID=3047 RepID=A0A7S3RAK6_DUNTE|mmetsp:Transcript_12754/g.34772  ORF Transcript_12754/g.34772 Transcript_12754/m.34772 type:complete len:415 (+) Transcript_12754:7-1251(+)|eukprot:CAMPEP_0202354378 /NCGR_PEP_ID=MMETSP1126-20121109/9722_1 /ASSEMBLY_ACC=CAM_ASM_000457 /TAXON_ID=3047 /ORGANISM="Dunaliella tertiolecta, Strain CCMP1320" /LENGTH=414 /DNA_ID=CAMNT_0048946833 /DNA_START=15 /DNA_END=1259 /DNA_ORIENTATION=+
MIFKKSTTPCSCPSRLLGATDVRPHVSRVSMQAASSKKDISRRDVLGGAASGVVLPGLLPFGPTPVFAADGGIPKAELADGLNISRVVKGCWQLSGGHRGDSATDRTSGQVAIEDFGRFVNAGVTTFDAADHYGPAEVLIGKYLASMGPEKAQELRNQVQVLTKTCLFDGLSMSNVSRSIMSRFVARSVERLGTKPDLIQFYWGEYVIPKYVDAAKYLADEQAAGQFGHLGVTNFDVKRIADIAEKGGVKVEANQLQYSLLDRRPENGMVEYCLKNNIRLLPYGVLAGGLLSSRYLGAPASSVVLDTFSKRKYAQVIGQAGGWEWFQSLLQVLDSIARKHSTSLSNIATRWVLDKPGVAGASIGARNTSHLSDYAALFSFNLDAGDNAAIQEVLERGKQPLGDCYQFERGLGPF